MPLRHFQRLIRRRLSRIFARSALDRAELVWAEEALYPRVLRDDMQPLSLKDVIAIEFLPRKKPSFTIDGLSSADRICIHSTDGARRMTTAALKMGLSSSFPAKEATSSAISLQAHGVDSMEAKVFFDWLHSHGVVFARRGDGSWGLARRERRGMGLLPHPDCRVWGVIYTQGVFSSLAESVANVLANRVSVARRPQEIKPSSTTVACPAVDEKRVPLPDNLSAAIDGAFPLERRAHAMSHFEGLAIEAAVRRGAKKGKTAVASLPETPFQTEPESREPAFLTPKRRAARL